MENLDVINAFFNGQKAKERNLHTENGVLMSYTTPIAILHGGRVLLNNQHYSKTTSAIQKEVCTMSPFKVVHFETQKQMTNDYCSRMLV